MRSIRCRNPRNDSRRPTGLAGPAIAAMLALAGCGGGGSRPANDPSPVQAVPDPAGTGTIRVRVIDYFGAPVAGASVYWLANSSRPESVTDPQGNATLENVPSVSGRVCAWYPPRGYGCDDDARVIVPAGTVLDLERQLRPMPGQPVAAILDTVVEPGGLAADGRTLDITIHLAVSDTAGWFRDNNVLAGTADCVAREGQELADFGPRCIRGVTGTDASYTSAGLVDAPEARMQTSQSLPTTVGLLLDQSSAVEIHEAQAVETRAFAAKILADRVLPDSPLLLAAFAADGPDGTNSSLLPEAPVTFLPAGGPGPFVGKPEAYAELDGLISSSGGIAPLYAAILATIDFVADRAIAGMRPALVVMANGRDDVCGSADTCGAMRDRIVAAARGRGVELVLLGGDPLYGAVSAGDGLWALAMDGSVPLVVGPSHLIDRLELARQLLTGPIPVFDVRVRLASDAPGAFHSGALVTGTFAAGNGGVCPMDCYPYVLPFSVRVP